MSRPLPSEVCWRDPARSERICSWLSGTNGFAGFLEVNRLLVNSMTLILASSGIASSMDTVASKVLMGKPPFIIRVYKKVFLSMGRLYMKKGSNSI